MAMGLSPPQGLVALIPSSTVFSGLTATYVAYGGTGGTLTSEAAFAYNASLNMMTVGGIKVTDAVTAANIVQGITYNTLSTTAIELVVGSSVVFWVNTSHVWAQGNGVGFIANGSDGTTTPIGWATNTTVGSAFYYPGSGVVELKNSTTAQTMRIYGTTTGPKYAFITHDANNAFFRSLDGQVAFAGAANATGATTGYFCIPSSAGTPTGVPANIPTGQIPMQFDTTNSRLYIYHAAAWHYIAQTA